jgi:phosphate starvation-inducible PhoH-like protein
MKMFLTRLGFGSKIVVTGDVTQVDLPGGVKSGLMVVQEILHELEDVSFQRLTAHDVVRHRLVGQIVAAYEVFDARNEVAAHREQREQREQREHRQGPGPRDRR